MTIKQLPRISRKDFRASRWRGLPAVVLDNVADWRAMERWTPEYLRTLIGQKEVLLRAKSGPPGNIYTSPNPGGTIVFDRYMDWVLETAQDLERICEPGADVNAIAKAVSGSGLEVSYYLDLILEEFSRELLADAPAPAWYSSAPARTRLWFGVLGTSSGLHADTLPNCNVQVSGKKHFMLFPPSQSQLLYRSGASTHCRLDPTLPDYLRFPLARKASGWECVLQPGESLYIPIGWYHQVTVVSGWAMNVNFFWPRLWSQTLMAPSLWEPLAGARVAGWRRNVDRFLAGLSTVR